MNLSPVHSARSLVNNYELILLETSHSSKDPSQAQLQKCFKIFDEIIPVLGQYQRVMKLIRDKLYDAVFSREYTIAFEPDLSTMVTESESNRAGKPSIERVPHFVILNKIMDERNKRAEDAEEHVKQLNAAIEELNEKISGLNKHIDGLEAAIQGQNVEIQELKGDIVKHVEESSQVGKELQSQRENMMSKTRTLECAIETLNTELAQENTKVIELSRFKKCHDDIQDDFRDPSSFSANPQKALFSAKEQKLRKDISEGEILENQLLKLRNTCIDEFEEYLETRVLEEREGVCSADKERSVEERRPFQTDERQSHETAFTSMITNLENELKQNQLHLSILKTDLDKLNQIKRESKAKDVPISEYHKDSPNDETDLLEVIKDASSNYHFLPQEPILNKYAITAFYSCNQGRTFHALQDVQQCKSCGQETLVCPHKVTTAERIFHLPLQCTHIKFSRPGLQVPTTSQRDLSDEATPSRGFHSTHSKKAYVRLWNDLATREHPFTIRKIPRGIEEDYLVSLIEQFYVSVVSDDVSNDEDECIPLLVSWYAFLNNRYQVPSVTVLVARDVVEAIATTAPSNGLVQLFAESLCGNLDPAAFRYYLILSRLVKTIQWVSMEDFLSFVKIVYPFMNVDDLEQFTMSYTSFSENNISGKLICEFLLQIILKQREPNFHEMEINLLNHLESSTASMNDVVFFEAMAEISPLSSERLCHRLFAQSKADSEASHVTISRLSQIGSFLDLHQRTAVMEMEVKKNLQVWLKSS